ncbi:MAG: triose-phosphate isomerase [Dehalococcoidia bacterium]|nr:triose-phosphate isomerase [Dehalococcoidia bacterium]
MRLPIIAGNWKMNTTVDEAVALVRDMLGGLEDIGGVEKVVCPPFVSLAEVKPVLEKSSVKLGAQNMHFEEKGAYTGEVSPVMLTHMCEYVIVGHSERRQYFGETDENVNRKVKAALKFNLKPIMCVGETLAENEAGKTEEVVTRQVKKGLAGVDKADGLVIAYEPIWAIGTGKAATGKQANATIGLIRRTVQELYGADVAQGLRIQYGGSVTGANIGEFISQPEIDGGLVGGASLKATDFVSIVEQTAKTKRA